MNGVRAAVTVGVWALFALALWASDARPAVLAVGALVTVLASLTFVVIDLAGALSRVTWVQPRRQPSSPRDRRALALAHQVRGAQWFRSTGLRDRLIAVLDERLLANYGIDRRHDPASANEVLTPALRALIGGSGRHVTSQRVTSQIVSDIEAL